MYNKNKKNSIYLKNIMEQESSLKSLPCDSINQKCDYERKKKKLLEKLSQDKFQNMKGSSAILEKLQKQRQNYQDRLIDQKEKIIYRQQLVVKKLNLENQTLSEQNTKLESKLISTNDQNRLLLSRFNQLNDQNKSLKDQLKKSQSISSSILTDLKNIRKTKNSINI